MKFLVDAQLPRRLARGLNDRGHDAIHTLDMPHGNATKDGEITSVADRDGRIVVSKDVDFRDSHLLRGTPKQLLLIRRQRSEHRPSRALRAALCVDRGRVR